MCQERLKNIEFQNKTFSRILEKLEIIINFIYRAEDLTHLQNARYETN